MTIVGIDEVGRGCWAGPVVAGAVVLGSPITGLKDSKQLSRLQRERLDVIIRQKALAFGVGWADVATINEVGLTAAIKLAMDEAVSQIALDYDEIIIDGNVNFLPQYTNARALIKADDTVKAVSAASIIAKVARDNYMRELAARYPAYGFERHVGYGTKLHRDQLNLHGVCELHRRSWQPIKTLLETAA